MSKIDWIVFDLGGVFLDVTFDNIVRDLAACTGLAKEVVRARLFEAPDFWTRFAEEEVTPAALQRDVELMLRCPVSLHDAVLAFNSELGPHIESTSRLVPWLKTRAKVACLSNTNSIHWSKLLESYSFMHQFDRRFASQCLGCSKPSIHIYEKVAAELNTPPSSILFFDDREENIHGARAAGWNAYLYRTHTGLVSDLAAHGFDGS